jgi:hypothetical protein
MKVNEVVNEGIADWYRKAKAGISGAVQGVKAARAGREEAANLKHFTDELFQAWAKEVARHPNLTPAQQSQLLVNWANQQFHDKPGTKIPVPTTLNNTTIADYIGKRTQEYFQTAQVEPQTVSQIRTGYAFPKSDADLEIQGYTYGFDVRTSKWYDEDSGREVTNPKDIQFLNKRYYDTKLAAKGGQVKDPDVTDNEPELNFNAPIKNPATSTAAEINDPKITDISSAFSAKRKEPWNPLNDLNESRVIKEGGNAIPSSTPVKKEDVKLVVDQAKKFLPAELLKGLQIDIGSAGYKVESGDIDIMVEADDTVSLFKTQEAKDPVKEAKQKLKAHFENQGVEANVNGRNVSIGVVYKESVTGQQKTAQVDVMVIHEAAIVAPWHQHGQRGMYSDPDFKGSEVFMLISSIAKHLGLKFDAFGAKLLRRDNNEVVARTRKQVAKVLLGPRAKEEDMNSVKSMLKALENDPDKESKLAQARQDAAKGLMRLPETAPPGTAQWFRKITDSL